MGLFKPAWMSTNPDKRDKALARVTDQKQLIKIVLTDMYKSKLQWEDQVLIRKNCLLRIKDENFLVMFAMALTQKEPVDCLGDAVLRNIQGEKALLYLSVNHQNSIMAAKAVDKINNLQLLEMIALNAALLPGARVRATKKITNEKILADLAINDQCYEVVGAALGKIDDQEVFARVALRQQGNMLDFDYYELRKKAIKNLIDQKLLNQIALDEKDNWKTRKAAAEGLHDQSALLDIVLHVKVDSVVTAAFNNITDQQILMKVALAEDCYHSLYAIEKLTDEECLKEVFLKTEKTDIKQAATKRMTQEFSISFYETLPAENVEDRTMQIKNVSGTCATADWWKKQVADETLGKAAKGWCLKQLVEVLNEASFLRQYIETNINPRDWQFVDTVVKNCTPEVIDFLESMVSTGDVNAGRLMRLVYTAEKLPNELRPHAWKQKNRFRDVHRDGHFGSCAGPEGHSDYIDFETIDPL